MNRDGQVWLDHNDDTHVYVVVDGPKQDEEEHGMVYYSVLLLPEGCVSRWLEQPIWEEDPMLTRVA